MATTSTTEKWFDDNLMTEIERAETTREEKILEELDVLWEALSLIRNPPNVMIWESIDKAIQTQDIDSLRSDIRYWIKQRNEEGKK